VKRHATTVTEISAICIARTLASILRGTAEKCPRIDIFHGLVFIRHAGSPSGPSPSPFPSLDAWFEASGEE